MVVEFSSVEQLFRTQAARTFDSLGICVGDDQLGPYVRDRFCSGDHSFIRVSDDGNAAALELHRLGWDSAIYDVEIGTISSVAGSVKLYDQIAAELVAVARAKGMKMLVARAPVVQVAWIQALENAGFRIMDVQTPLCLHLNGAKHEPRAALSSQLVVREARDEDLDAIIALSVHAFGQSHLYADPHLHAERTDDLHRRWVRNNASGRASFVLVATIENVVAGFVAGLWDNREERMLRLGHGHIDLIAVRETKRKAGLGRALMAAAIDRYAKRNANVITVSTQATNLAAIALYQRIGFSLTPLQVTLHGWLDHTEASPALK